jgi:hypothetical protein
MGVLPWRWRGVLMGGTFSAGGVSCLQPPPGLTRVKYGL